MVSIGPMQFAWEAGLYALLSLVPFIIIYLIRPKPKTLEVPSLMFFIKATGRNKLTSFLRNFISDLLFLIQLLLLLSLALSVAKPFTNVQRDISAANTVIVLDVSASSQTKEASGTRFEIAVAGAKKLLGAQNTIILAKDIPLLGVQEADAGDAVTYLNSLKPRDSGSKIGEAVLLAGELLQGKEGRVIVLSDFISTAGISPNAAKGVLQSKGITVDYISTAKAGKRNVGFVDAVVNEDASTVYIRNYDDKKATVAVKGTGLDKSMTLEPGAVEPIPFQTPAGVTKLELTGGGDLPADDVFYLSAPDKKEIKVLLITNNASVFLRNALTSSPSVKLDITEPPVIKKGAYDVIVIDKINQRQVLPGTFEDLKQLVDKGTNVIINSQEDLGAIDFRGLLPVSVTGLGDGAAITVEQINRFTKDMEFGKVDSFIKSEAKERVVTMASASASPIIAYTTQGAGKIVYYGILEKASDFKISPNYPIFWQELLRYLIDQKDIRLLNAKIGSTLILDREETIETPEGKVKTNNIVLENNGVYKFRDRNIAVNLLNDLESDVNPKEEAAKQVSEFELKPVTQTKKYPLEIILLTAAGILLLLEMLYMKIRGDV